MARIAYLSPLPPATTGVATYGAAVLAELRAGETGRRHVLDARWPPPAGVDDLVRHADLAVYHLGNNVEFHGELYRLALGHPGLVVLHDLALDDLAAAFAAAGDPIGARTEAEAVRAAAALGDSMPDLQAPLATPWCALAVRRARGVVVHSEFGRRYLEAFGCRTPAFVVPHPVIPPSRAAASGPARGRRIRERFGDAVLVGVLGDIGRAKAIDVVLDAAAEVDVPTHVTVVGRRIPGYDVHDVVRGAEGRVTVVTDVSERDFYAWLHASDIVVNLRRPHRGEVSGTLIRALQAGKPVVVDAIGTYLDLPEDVVVHVRSPDVAALADALSSLAADASRRERIGERARAYVERLAGERRTARGYERAIEATLRLARDPARAAMARWAAALASVGVTDDLPSGAGTSYVEALQEVRQAPVPGVDAQG